VTLSGLVSHRNFIRLMRAALVVWIVATVGVLLAPHTSARIATALIDVRVPTPGLLVLDISCGAGALAAAAGWRRTHRVSAEATSATELRASQAIVERYGDDSLAPFVLRPDKSFAFTQGGVVAYRRIGETMVVSGDPVGPDGFHGAAIEALRERCAREGSAVVVYGAGPRYLDAYRRAGLRAIQVGEEAVVDPAQFTLKGRAVRKLRQSVQRVHSRGWSIWALDGRDLDTQTRTEIDLLERAWQEDHERISGFAMSFGRYEHGASDGDLVLLGRAPDGQLRAVMRFLAHRGNLSLDTMRRVGETPNGLNEALVCRALQVARERGVQEVSLNYAGLAQLTRDRSGVSRINRAARHWLLARLGHHFQLERLVRFNEKFSPQWRPRYLVYDSRLTLPRSVYRVLQAEGYLKEPRPARTLNRPAVARPPLEAATSVPWSAGQ
jgi:lysyl-tRNA synthetase, class II